MSDYSIDDLEHKTRPEIVAIRARMVGDPEFQKALVNGATEARLALDKISRALINTASGQLSTDELRISGFEPTAP